MKKVWVILLLLWSASAQAEEVSPWHNIYAQVQQNYVYEISVEDLAAAALKGLHLIDKDLQTGNGSSRITLYYKGKVVKVLRKPENKNDARAWGNLSEQIIAAAEEKSPTARERDFEAMDVLAAEMVKILDKDSKFYGNIDEAQGVKQRNHRVFATRREGEALYIKIGAFNKQTLAELKKALSENNEAAYLVLDLKGCPGGMPGEAIAAADLFLDDGIIASAKGKNPQEETYYNASAGDEWLAKPVFTLVDGATASAAEILAAALQEQGRAKIIGTATKGKGSMQKLVGLPGGSVLAITNGFFMTPAANKIDGRGIRPDVCTFEMPESKDLNNLLQQQNGVCGAEEREEAELELKVVDFMWKK